MKEHPYNTVLFIIRDKNLTDHQKTDKILNFLFLELCRTAKMKLINWLKLKKKQATK